jgi:hypothetical protein
MSSGTVDHGKRMTDFVAEDVGNQITTVCRGGRSRRAGVSSVDDDPAWLGRAVEFLGSCGLSPEELYLWPSTPSRTYELVFHDLAAGSLREESMSTAVQASERFVAFDDARHRGHRATMKVTGRQSCRIFSLRRFTLHARRRQTELAVRDEMHGQRSAAGFTSAERDGGTNRVRGRVGRCDVPWAPEDRQA